MTDRSAESVFWEQLEALYDAAFRLTEPERSAFLEEHCRDDTVLRRELESLLALSPAARAFFTQIGESVRDALADRLADPPDARIGSMIRQYLIESRLGAGGMGVVFRARDTQLQRAVAIKLLSEHLVGEDAARRRFLHEARAVAALDHPNICAIHEIGETASGVPFLVMAFCDGETLRTRIGRGPLPFHEALDIAIQMARGIAAAHLRGILHRDIKPGNVILTEDGLVKLVDFGIARLPDATLTSPGLTPGTIAYMAPEQLRGGNVDQRGDLWSLGVVLYEMLSGARPFEGDTNESLRHAVLNDAPVPLGERRPDLAQAVVDIVDHLLEKDPDSRYTSAEELLADLVAAVSTVTPHRRPRVARHRGHRAKSWRPARAWRTGWRAVVTIGAIAGAGALGIARYVRARPALMAPPPINIGILPVRAADSLEVLANDFRLSLSAELRGVPGIRLAASRAIASLDSLGVTPDSVAQATESDFLIDADLAQAKFPRTSRVAVQAHVLLLENGLIELSETSTRFPISTDSIAESLAHQVVLDLMVTLRHTLRERLLETGTMVEQAARLRRLAGLAASAARRNDDADDLATAAHQYDSANALLMRSAQADPDWAVPRLEQARLAPARAILAMRRGGGSGEAGQIYNQAIAALNDVLRETPGDPLALAYRGRLRWQRVSIERRVSLDRAAVDSARQDLRHATERDPELALAANDYARVLFLGYSDYVEADRYAQQALANDQLLDRAAEVIDRMARVTFELNQDAVAAEWCSRVQRDYPLDRTGDQCVLDVMAWGDAPADPDTAWALYRRLAGQDSEGIPRFGLDVAAVLARAPDVARDSALSVLSRIMSLVGDSDRVSLLPWEAAVWLRLNDRPRALELFERFRKADSVRARLLSSRRALRGLVSADSSPSPR